MYKQRKAHQNYSGGLLALRNDVTPIRSSGSKPREWFSMQAKGETEADIFIFDTIGDDWYGGVSAKGFASELQALGDVTTLNVHINSPGGSVFDGVAIYNLLAKHKADVQVHIEGMALSIASIIAMAGNKVTIAENAMFMIHNPWGIVAGDANELRAQANVMDQVKSTMINTYQHRTGQDADLLAEMMDAETWLTGAEAVEQGFADEVSAPMAMAACAAFDYGKYKHAPEELVAKGREFKARLTPEAEHAGSTSNRHKHLDLLKLEL